MNTKRILAALMGILMLVTLAVPAFAYSNPSADLVSVEWTPAISLDFSSHVATYTGGTLSYVNSNANSAMEFVTDADGNTAALHLVNDTTTNANYYAGSNNAWTSNNDKYISPTQGATMDVYMKVDNLPKITDSTYLRDDGVNFDTGKLPSGILFGGLAFQMLGRSTSWDMVSGHTSNVTQGVMVYYDNETLGTNAAFIMGVGCRNATVDRPVTFFFNIPEGEYARYTISYDPVTLTTRFYVNGVAQTYDGTQSDAYPGVGLMYYSNKTVTGNAFNICLNGPGHASTSGNRATYYCDITLDQACTYADAITPVADQMGKFVEEVPIDDVELKAWMGVARDLHESYYTPSSWQAIQDAMAEIDLEKEDLLQSEVTAWATALKTAIRAREYVGTDKLYVAQTYSTSNAATNGTAWTCGAMLITEEGYKLADYSVSDMHLNSWTRIIGQRVTDDVYLITKVVKGAYRNNNKPAVGEDEVVPKNGFIFAFHSNEESAAWNPVEGGSQYAAQEFGERNALAFQNMDLAAGDYVELQNIEMNFAGDSTLSTTGTWIHRYDPNNTNPTPIYRTSSEVNQGAEEDGPKYLARDQFDNFETTSYIVKTDEVPNFILSAEGNGTASIEGKEPKSSENGVDKYVIENGETITLVANGANFSYWKNAKTNAIISTEKTLTFAFGLSEMELVAVFEASEEVQPTHVVTFKDAITGKIVKTVEVADGDAVDPALVPEVTPIYGYIFSGWFAKGGVPLTNVITADTTFVGYYKVDESASYTLTVEYEDGSVATHTRRFGASVMVNGYGEDFSYWMMDGSFLSSEMKVLFSMPNRDVTLTAVRNSDAKSFAPSTKLLSAFVDENGTLTATFSRDVTEGYTLVESGVLMTRKATPADLVATTLNSAVTRGVSTASADKDVFGFAKQGMFDKAGTWYLRGYLTYKDEAGKLNTAYTVTNVLEIAEGATDPVVARVLMTDVEFAIEGEFDPTFVATEIFNSTDYNASENGREGYKAFFPSTTQADDGTLFVVYYYGPSHAYYNQSEGKLAGVLHLVKSTDNGMTWSEPEVIVDLTDENAVTGDVNRESRDPNLQKLSDGTLVLTFPVRAAIGKAGLNGSTYNNYWYERAYYMTSTDNGKTWNEMKEIECDYFSKGEPFLYDDPTRTTGCWVKNGSIAELDNGDLLFPLYGAVDCSTRAILETVVVKAKNNGDGTLTFYKDWANGTDTAHVNGEGFGNELAVWAYGDNVYGLVRNTIHSSGVDANSGGLVYRSTDGGANWELYDYEYTLNNCINQPNFAKIDEERVLVNYSVPLGSVNGTQKRSARPIYGKLFNITTGDWDEYAAVSVFDVKNAGQTNTDMGNPASILLDDGRIFTVGYSNPSNGASIIAGQYTTVDYYDPNAQGGGAGGTGGTLLYGDNFDNLEDGSIIAVNNAAAVSGGPTSQNVSLTDNFNAIITNYSGKGAAEIKVTGGKVEFHLNNTRGANKPEASISTKNGVTGDAMIQFNYSFGDISADNTSGSRNRIYIKMYDEDQTNFYITPGKVQLSTSTSLTFAHTQDTVYTIKAMHLVGTTYVKVWEAGTAEPEEWMISEAQALATEEGLPFTVLYESKSTSTSKAVERSVFIDEVKLSAVSLDIAGLTPASGLVLKAGKSSKINVKYDTDLPMSGTTLLQAYSDNPAVASVDSNGVVTGINAGVANIVATDGVNTYKILITVR